MIQDVDLMEAVRQGDAEAFEELVRRHQRPLVRYFFRLLWDQSLAEDCAQEVFCRLYQARERYEPRARFQTYLYRIATHYWIDLCRRRAHAPRPLSLQASAPDGEERTLEGTVAGAGPSPSEHAVRREDVRRLRGAIERLTGDQRALIALTEGEHLSHEEAAHALGIPIGTVKSRLHAAFQRLREMLEEGEA